LLMIFVAGSNQHCHHSTVEFGECSCCASIAGLVTGGAIKPLLNMPPRYKLYAHLAACRRKRKTALPIKKSICRAKYALGPK
jgi:hypothetical protein